MLKFNKMILSVLVGAVGLSGCSSLSPYSFAPPPVELRQVKPGYGTSADALADINKYVEKFTKAQKNSADARQVFELPGLLATLGGIAATAFGGGSDGVLVAGTASAALRTGNTYYAPQSKAGMYRDAVTGLMCLRAVGNGVTPLEFQRAGLDRSQNATADENLYYNLLVDGARAIESILTDRLSGAGSVSDASNLAAEYEKLVKTEIEARTARENATNVGVRARSQSEDDAGRAAAIAELQANIQKCVLRARA